MPNPVTRTPVSIRTPSASAFGVRLPHRHRMCHQFAHRRLEVIVADGPASYAGRTGADSALVEDQDVLTPAEPVRAEFPGQMPGRGQSVDACTDDDVPAVSGDHGTCLPDLRRCGSATRS